MSKITVGLMRELEKRVLKGEISYSRMVELLNETLKFSTTLNGYYKINPEKIKIFGEKYFKVDPEKASVFQISFAHGIPKKGRPYFFGIYRIAINTLVGNYSKYIIPSNEIEYNEAFERMIKLLK